jgi:hypothetical protein
MSVWRRVSLPRVKISSWSVLLAFLVFTYLLHGATVLVELWPPHVFCVRFRDEVLQGGVASPTPNPQPGGPGYLS